MTKRATYDDVLSAPENTVAEILDGQLFLSPRPALTHATGTSALLGQLWGPFDRGRGGPGGWWLLVEPELHLGEHVIVPDLAGWRRERMSEPPRGAFSSLPPDWACEVLSPSAERIDRARKLRIYADAGVAHVWLLDPIQRTLEVLVLRVGAWAEAGVVTGDRCARVEPFEAFELELDALWPRAGATSRF